MALQHVKKYVRRQKDSIYWVDKPALSMNTLTSKGRGLRTLSLDAPILDEVGVKKIAAKWIRAGEHILSLLNK